jgi:excisionase family DNA binding protein
MISQDQASERAPELLSARNAAALLGISQRHLHAMVASGRLPKPIKLGRSARWSRAALLDWIEREQAQAEGSGA